MTVFLNWWSLTNHIFFLIMSVSHIPILFHINQIDSSIMSSKSIIEFKCVSFKINARHFLYKYISISQLKQLRDSLLGRDPPVDPRDVSCCGSLTCAVKDSDESAASASHHHHRETLTLIKTV